MTEDIPARHRVSIRFASTLIGNGISLSTGFLASLIIARTLGPGRYGNLSFVMATCIAIAPLIGLGSSSAFFTFVSGGRRSPRFFRNYALWLGAQWLVMAAVALAPWDAWNRWLWLGQPARVLTAALFGGFLSNQAWLALQQIGESTRETIQVQVARAAINVGHVLIVFAAARFGRLSVATVLWATALEYAAAMAWFALSFDWNAVVSRSGAEETIGFDEYAAYCRPLILTTWLGFFATYSDRWLLQRFGGAVQQGFFSLGEQFATVSLIGTTALLNILWKEVAHAHQTGDAARTRDLYVRTTRVLYFVASAIACFLAPFSRDIIRVLMGSAYADAWPVFAVLVFYPTLQSLGQIFDTFLLATHKTSRTLTATAAALLLSAPAAYFVLAPRGAAIPGLGLGSAALAVKILLVQVVTVNLRGYMICRDNRWEWEWKYQITIPLLLACVGALAWTASAFVGPATTLATLTLRLTISGAVDAALIAALLLRDPRIAGIAPEQLRRWRAAAGL